MDNGLERQSFEVRTSNGLTRKVRINLVDKINFSPYFLGPAADGLYQYQYTLPRDLPESMFPMEIYLYEETGSFTPASGEELSVDLISDPNNDGRQTWRYKKVMTYAEYTADSDKIFVSKFKANGTLSGSYTMDITNEYAFKGSATLQEATIITVTESDGTNDGILSWEKDAASSSQTVSISLNKANVNWSYTIGENFTATREGNVLTITPTSMKEETESSLTVMTEDRMIESITLKVVGTTELKITAANLRGSGDGFSSNGIYDEEFTIYIDEDCTQRIGICTFTRKGSTGNRYYELSEDLSLSIPADVTTLYFRCKPYSDYDIAYTSSISVENLKKAANGTMQTLNFQSNW